MEKRLLGIDFLRLLLLVMLFLHHLPLSFGCITAHFEPLGSLVVTTFFMLSGFCLCHCYAHKGMNYNAHFIVFFIKKIKQIAPYHFITLFLCVALVCYHMHKTGTHLATFNFSTLLQNAFLLHSWNVNEEVYFSFNSVSWFLSVLLFLYVCFPALLKMLSKSKLFVFISSFAIAIYSVAMHLIEGKMQVYLFYIFPLFRLFDFTLGMLLFSFYSKTKEYQSIKIKLGISFLCLCIVILSLVFYKTMPTSISQDALFWLPSAFLIYLFSLLNKLFIRYESTLKSAHRLFLPFFLSHQIILNTVSTPVLHLHKSIYNVVTISFLFMITLCISYLFYRSVKTIEMLYPVKKQS